MLALLAIWALVIFSLKERMLLAFGDVAGDLIEDTNGGVMIICWLCIKWAAVMFIGVPTLMMHWLCDKWTSSTLIGVPTIDGVTWAALSKDTNGGGMMMRWLCGKWAVQR